MARMVPKSATARHLQNEVGICIRTRDVNGLTPKICWVLQWFRLCQIFNSIFVKPNKASVNIPRTVKSYSAWEYPHLKPVNEMFYRHGYGKICKKCSAFPDNVLIARPLGKQGILHAGLNGIQRDRNTLRLFQLSSPRGRIGKKKKALFCGKWRCSNTEYSIRLTGFFFRYAEVPCTIFLLSGQLISSNSLANSKTRERARVLKKC